MLYKFCYGMILFSIYSVIGYVSEVISASIHTKKITLSRGYLIGPYIPIFGFGALIIILFLSKYENDLITLFILSMFYCSLLEYFTSYVMEKIFNLRWWNYSDRKFNVNGRICLETGVMFGVASVLLIRYANPFITGFVKKLSYNNILVLGTVLFIVVLFDFVVSTFTIVRLEIDTGKYINKDATAKVKAEVKKSLEKYMFFHNRLFGAFPSLSLENTSIIKVEDILKKLKKNKK